ncbi:SDR family oxidoreductase [Pseudomonadales bacterium]|nr:SDR family oxidoreductase [Pseudomonadales bacterium]
MYEGKKVLVTGASTGIGYALAEELAKRGSDVIITARSRDKLETLAQKIKDAGGNAHIFVEDLSLPNSGMTLYDQIKSAGLSIDILINNAGYGRWGELTSHDRDDYTKMLQLNITTLTDLCHLYIPDMVTQGGGGIINVGSMASLSPIPYASVYSSSKAYVLMFSEAIRYEYRDQGIKVMALLPGGTESEFARVATEKSEKLSERYKEGSAAGTGMQTSHEVALECLEAFEKNKQYILCGGKNRLLHMLTKLMSRQRVLEMVGGMFKKVAG